MSVADRNARLEALKTATVDYVTRRTTQLQTDVAVVKAILRGRTGSESLPTAVSAAANDLVVNEIDDFLAT